MPRAMWSGSISFGLVNIPVKLFSATSSKTVRFNQIDDRTGARIRYRKVSSADGEEVPSEHIVKGYEVGPDRYVLISDAELEALDPKAVRTIDIEEFVDLSDIDPVYFDHAYQVAPGTNAGKPYALLAEAMEAAGKVAVARVVMRTKQYLVAIRVKDGRLLMSTMRYHDEIVGPDEIGEYDELDEVEVTDKEREMAAQLIASLESTFEPGSFSDTYREKVLDLIEQKAAGEQPVVASAPASDEKVVDLMAALEASVAAAKDARERHPSTPDDAAGDDTRKTA